MNSYPDTNYNQQYFRMGTSRSRVNTEVTRENDAYINRASSQIISPNPENDIYKENRLEVIIHDLQ